jgi:hypothetical protein
MRISKQLRDMHLHKLARWDLSDEISHMNIEGALTRAASHRKRLIRLVKSKPFPSYQFGNSSSGRALQPLWQEKRTRQKKKTLKWRGNGLIGGGAHGWVRALDEDS